jgi:hypothetical protein
MKGKEMFDVSVFQKEETLGIFFDFINNLSEIVASSSVTRTHKYLYLIDSSRKWT